MGTGLLVLVIAVLTTGFVLSAAPVWQGHQRCDGDFQITIAPSSGDAAVTLPAPEDGPGTVPEAGQVAGTSA